MLESRTGFRKCTSVVLTKIPKRGPFLSRFYFLFHHIFIFSTAFSGSILSWLENLSVAKSLFMGLMSNEWKRIRLHCFWLIELILTFSRRELNVDIKFPISSLLATSSSFSSFVMAFAADLRPVRSFLKPFLVFFIEIKEEIKMETEGSRRSNRYFCVS